MYPAIMCAPEAHPDTLVEQLRPRHLQRAVGVTSMGGRGRVAGSEDARDSEPPSRVDQAHEITDDLTGILLAGVQAAACLETDGVDSDHYSAHLLLAWYAAAEQAPAELQDLLDRVAVAGVDWDKARLPGLLQAFID